MPRVKLLKQRLQPQKVERVSSVVDSNSWSGGIQRSHPHLYNSRWAEYSKRYRQKNPLCVSCKKQGVITPVEQVDHVIPHQGDYELFWDPNNHQGLCGSCHSKKTSSEDGGFGNPIVA